MEQERKERNINIHVHGIKADTNILLTTRELKNIFCANRPEMVSAAHNIAKIAYANFWRFLELQ